MEKDWLEARKKGIGGSDAPIICGVSPWRTPYQLYLEKRGEGQPQGENEYMAWGRLLEPVILKRYEAQTGKTVTVPDEILVHPKYPWMIASVDGLLPDRVIEVKSARHSKEWGVAGSDEIPEHYLLQVTHYMSVTGRNMADLAVLIGGSDFRTYTVRKDPELEALLIEHEQRFWEQVKSGNPPELVSYDDAVRRFRFSKSLVIQATAEVAATVTRISQISDQQDLLKEEEERMKTIVMKHMGEADTLALGEVVLATWKNDKPGKRFDTDAFKKAHPNLYDEFLVPKKPTRRFLVK